MGLFRKKPTLNEQMLRDAGLDRVVFTTPLPGTQPEPQTAQPEPEPETESTVPEPAAEPSPPVPPPGGLASGPSDWDAVTTAMAPGIHGHRVDFTTLETGDLIIASDDVDGDMESLANAVEEHIAPPYRAIATRQDGDLWGVGAKRIQVVEFAYPDAETLQLTQRDGTTEFRIDDGPTDVAPPTELLQLGAHAGGDWLVAARRIDGDYWDVMVNRF